MNGYLLIDKPLGWSSFDVVAKVRGILRAAQSNEQPIRQAQGEVAKSNESSAHSSLLTAHSPKVKVGHTGTLDPLATGLMIVVVGSYCKRAQEFTKLDKTYEVSMKLGQTSTTGDEEGIKTVSKEQRVKSSEELQTALKKFKGEIMQVPPAYSAIKINGQRAYKLARAGKEVKLEPRKVTVYDINNYTYAYPEVTFTTKVSSGTYIRSLVQDIGESLGTGAYMSGLRRTKVGTFDIKDAVTMNGLDGEAVSTNLSQLPEIAK